MNDHRDNTPDKAPGDEYNEYIERNKDTLPAAPDWYTARLQQLTERTRQLEQEKELKARLGPWQLIETLTESDDLILACRESDGAQMIWRASMLLRNLRGPTPYHLGFQATHWMRLPPPPGAK